MRAVVGILIARIYDLGVGRLRLDSWLRCERQGSFAYFLTWNFRIFFRFSWRRGLCIDHVLLDFLLIITTVFRVSQALIIVLVEFSSMIFGLRKIVDHLLDSYKVFLPPIDVSVHVLAQHSRRSGFELSQWNVSPLSVKFREIWVQPFELELLFGKA